MPLSPSQRVGSVSRQQMMSVRMVFWTPGRSVTVASGLVRPLGSVRMISAVMALPAPSMVVPNAGQCPPLTHIHLLPPGLSLSHTFTCSLLVSLSHTHLLAPSRSLSLTHIHLLPPGLSLTHTFTCSLPVSLSHTHSLAPSRSLSLTHIHCLPPCRSLTHNLSIPHPLYHSLSHTFTCPASHTHSLSLPLLLSLTHTHSPPPPSPDQGDCCDAITCSFHPPTVECAPATECGNNSLCKYPPTHPHTPHPTPHTPCHITVT